MDIDELIYSLSNTTVKDGNYYRNNTLLKKIFIESFQNGWVGIYDKKYQPYYDLFLRYYFIFGQYFEQIWETDYDRHYEDFADMIDAGSPKRYLQQLKKQYPEDHVIWQHIEERHKADVM